jgi:Glycosyl transferase family 2
MNEPIVCVPARNEAERLPHLIEALRNQTWIQTHKRALSIVLVLNNCTDDSRAVVKRIALGAPELSVHLLELNFERERAHVGSARRLAMNTAISMIPDDPLLLSTDADAVPRHDWVDANLRAIAGGADLVGGHIVGNKDEEAHLGPGFVRRATRHLYYIKLIDRLAALVDPSLEDPWPRHTDHTGASIAVRGEVYAAVGGMSALPFREDVAFVQKICRAGYRLRHSLDVEVTVSARLDGRAPGGMTDCLKSWMADELNGIPHLVDDPRAIVLRLRQLRDKRESTIPHEWEGRMLIHNSAAPEPSESRTRTDVETAISQLERLIAIKESSLNVTGSPTMDRLQSNN